MKIKRNVENEEVKFSEIRSGTVFLSGGIPYVKTDDITTDEEDVFNALILETGEFDWLDENDLVYPRYDAELLIP